MISFPSYVASFTFRIEIQRRARFDAMKDEMAETHRVIRGVDVDGEESVGDGFGLRFVEGFSLSRARKRASL